MASKQEEIQKKLFKDCMTANTIASELRRRVGFKITSQKTDKGVVPAVLVDNNETMTSYTWSVEKFYNRYYFIQDYYADMLDDGIVQRYNKDNDPFYDPPEPVFKGTLMISLDNWFKNIKSFPEAVWTPYVEG